VIPLPYRLAALGLLLAALVGWHYVAVHIAVAEQKAQDAADIRAANEAQKAADSQRDKLLGELSAQDNPKIMAALSRLGGDIAGLRKARDAGIQVKTVFPPGCKAAQATMDEFNAR